MDSGSNTRDVSLSDVRASVAVRAVVLFVLVVGVIGGLHAYLAHRVVDGLGAHGPAQLAGYLIFAALFFSIPVGFAAGRRRPSFTTRAALWISHVWIGVFGLLLVSVVAAELVRAVVAVTQGRAPWDLPYAAASVSVALAAAGWGTVVARGRAKISRHAIPIRDLGEGLRGLKVVQISDIHIGQTLDARFLRRIVEQVNALDADIVAVTGDLVDGFVSSTRDEVTALADLRAKLGVFYVSGNHEYYYGGPAWEAEVARLGLTVLRNEHRIVERGGARLAIAGVTDHDAGHFGERHACRPDLALSGIAPEIPRLLLAHQPRSAFLVKGERVDLQLSGHTHAGQIFPFNFFVRLQQPVVRGLERVNGIAVYTHAGTGYWGPPMRVGPAPEIAELTLVPGP